jgi:hypothetical protein
MKMFRNYDGRKSTFGDTSIADTVSTNVDLVSSFAAMRASDSAMTVMVINKQLAASATVTLNLANFTNSGTAQVWQLDSTNTIRRLGDLTVATNSVNTILPAQTITLFVLPPKVAPPVLNRTSISPPGAFNFNLNGQSGQTYVIYYSTNLYGTTPISWQAISTNTLNAGSTNLSFGIPDRMRFYRAQWLQL